MKYVRPSARLFEAMEVPEAVEVIRKYAPKILDMSADSYYMNQTLYRIFKDDYPSVMKEALYELEIIPFNK